MTSPYPADQANNANTNGPRSRPYDWVLANDALHAFAAPTHIGQSVFAAGAVIDTRVYQPIGELAPAMATDSAATAMQHMAVVRDFVLP